MVWIGIAITKIALSYVGQISRASKKWIRYGISGKYIGEAYVVFNGSRNEKLGIKNGK